MANRLWYLFMGEGISRSLDDFGGQGEPPTHPDLLDALALELVDHDWNLKHLIREIVLSRTYRQSSRATAKQLAKDPDNRMFARQSRFRLPAEMIRDNALAVSGLLVHELGGISIRPYQPAGYYRHLNFPKRTYKSDTNQNQWRRGVYVHWQRQFLHPMLRAFDAPSREECTVQRTRSNTAIAAMMECLNVVRASGRTATRAEVEPLVPMIAPFAPHIAEELWERLGYSESVFAAANWPSFDEQKASEDSVTIAVQVNGKLRASIDVPNESAEEDVVTAARADENVARHIDGFEEQRVIYVKHRLVNFVVT